MDPESLKNSTAAATRKVRFAPKAPRRVPKSVVPKSEVAEDDDAAQANELMRHFNVFILWRRIIFYFFIFFLFCSHNCMAPTQVAFGYGGASASIRSYGTPRGATNSSRYQDPASGGGLYGSGLSDHKEYKEPWDYYTYYPVTLPLRRPYSGNPELLDEEEFGEASESTAYDENSTNPAMELGLMDENQEASMLFLQLPATMPMIKQAATAEVKENASSSKPPEDAGQANRLKPSEGAGSIQKTCRLEELPSGFMGKMLVYKSGAIKLKLGDTLYDVSPGLDCVFAQDVVAINTEDKCCCVLGELKKRAVVTPDVDSALSSMDDLG
uniref:DNA-directed RNA polymerase III subunit RPC4 n=1 Tax=Vitis vinifera TaxID=29760 RepID=F6HGP2_VITVI